MRGDGGGGAGGRGAVRGDGGDGAGGRGAVRGEGGGAGGGGGEVRGEGGGGGVGLDWGVAVRHRRDLTPHVRTVGGVAAFDAGAQPVTLGRGLLRLCCGPSRALLLLVLLLRSDECADPAGAPRRGCLRWCGWRLGGWVRGLAPNGDTRAPHQIHGLPVLPAADLGPSAQERDLLGFAHWRWSGCGVVVGCGCAAYVPRPWAG